MDKKEFLSALEQSLSVLQEDELRDIVSEYEQHIDIKVEKGLSEEEAIADFGSLQELTGEILEAYHVRVDYADKAGRSRKRPGKGMLQGQAENFEKLKETGERGGHVLWERIKGAGVWMGNGFRWGWMQMRRFAGWMCSFRNLTVLGHEEIAGMDTEAPGCKEAGQEDSIYGQQTLKGGIRERKEDGEIMGQVLVRDGKRTAGAGAGGKTLQRTAGRILRWAMETIQWGIRLAWNGCWMLFSIFTGGFGLFSLFAMGVLAVLLIEGYPLVGVTVGCVGMVFCMFSAAGLGMTLLRHENPAPAAAREPWEETSARQSRRIHRAQKSKRVLEPGKQEAAGQPERYEEEKGEETEGHA